MHVIVSIFRSCLLNTHKRIHGVFCMKKGTQKHIFNLIYKIEKCNNSFSGIPIEKRENISNFNKLMCYEVLDRHKTKGSKACGVEMKNNTTKKGRKIAGMPFKRNLFKINRRIITNPQSLNHIYFSYIYSIIRRQLVLLLIRK